MNDTTPEGWGVKHVTTSDTPATPAVASGSLQMSEEEAPRCASCDQPLTEDEIEEPCWDAFGFRVCYPCNADYRVAGKDGAA